MGYIEQSEIDGLLPTEFQIAAMDDDGDGVADPTIWPSILAAASGEIDGRLGQRYSVPFTAPYPAPVAQAAKVFSLYYTYKRRGISEALNPWAEEAKAWREKLDAIAKGDQPLTASSTQKNPAGVVISEDSKLYSEGGLTMV
jgi:phage gp36-like protein